MEVNRFMQQKTCLLLQRTCLLCCDRRHVLFCDRRHVFSCKTWLRPAEATSSGAAITTQLFSVLAEDTFREIGSAMQPD